MYVCMYVCMYVQSFAIHWIQASFFLLCLGMPLALIAACFVLWVCPMPLSLFKQIFVLTVTHATNIYCTYIHWNLEAIVLYSGATFINLYFHTYVHTGSFQCLVGLGCVLRRHRSCHTGDTSQISLYLPTYIHTYICTCAYTDTMLLI